MITYILLSIILFSADRISKIITFKNRLTLLNDLNIIPKILTIRYTENYGIAFGLFSNSIFINYILPIFFIVLLFIYIRKINNFLFNISFVLIFSGFLGNFFDKIFYGFVVDMIFFPFMPFFVCNLADIFIFFGVISILYHFIKQGDLKNG